MDKLIGKLVAELDQLKLRDKTLVVFVGDNGSVGGGKVHGRAINGGKGSLQEGGSRVPLIVSWPGVTPAGVARNDLVDLTDFFPTFTELAGAKLPEGVTIDGHSLAPQLKGQPGRSREWIYVQLGDKYYARDVRWKLNHEGQLFDLKDAPFREIQVPIDSSDASAQAARNRLHAVLRQLNPAPAKPESPSPPVPKAKQKKNQPRQQTQ
jgi:arylsulfatase A